MPLSATFEEVRQRTTLVDFLVEVEHQFRAVKHGVLEIIRKLDGVEVAGVGTELAEHAVAQIVLIIVEHLLFLTRLRILGHVAQNLDGSIGARLLTKRTSGALVVTILVALEYQAATMTLSHMECGLAVLRVLLSRLVGEEVLEIFLPRGLHTNSQSLQAVPDFSEICFVIFHCFLVFLDLLDCLVHLT